MSDTVEKEPAWKVGDRWKTRLRQIFVVIETLEGGGAMLQMIYPYKTKPMKQVPIPVDWQKV